MAGAEQADGRALETGIREVMISVCGPHRPRPCGFLPFGEMRNHFRVFVN